MPRFIYFECSSVVMTINYQTQSLLLQVNCEPRGRRGLRSNRMSSSMSMSMLHHQPSHRFGGCCRGRHCHCVAVLLYFPALPNRIYFCFGNTTVRLNQHPLCAHVKNWPAFPRSLLSHIKNKNEPTYGCSASRGNR